MLHPGDGIPVSSARFLGRSRPRCPRNRFGPPAPGIARLPETSDTEANGRVKFRLGGNPRQ
jgi:hypothetical protein